MYNSSALTHRQVPSGDITNAFPKGVFGTSMSALFNINFGCTSENWCHPEKKLFSFSKKIFSGSKYLKNVQFNFEKRKHCPIHRVVVQLVYEDAEIVCQTSTLEAALTSTVNTAQAGRRNRRGRTTIKVGHSYTLRQVKLLMYPSLEIHPLNMDCYVRGKLLENDDATLQQLDVALDDVVSVVTQQRTPLDDYASIAEWTQIVTSNGATLPDLISVPAQPVGIERGFVDTLLVGTIHNASN